MIYQYVSVTWAWPTYVDKASIALSNVNALVVPVDQTMTDKGVTQILKARRGVVAARFPTELLTQSGKGVFDCATAEPSAARGEKEHLCLERRRNRLVAKARVTRQCTRGAGMQRYQTRWMEFGLRKREYALGEINLGHALRDSASDRRKPAAASNPKTVA